MQNQQEKLAGVNPPGVFLAERDLESGQWTPVGYLTREHTPPDAPPSGLHIFSYVRAARENNLDHVWGFKEEPKWDALYMSDELPPPFSWRIMSEKRSDYGRHLSALDMSAEEARANPFTLLARAEGRKITDSFETFAKPIPKDGRYDIPFFLRGLTGFLGNGNAHYEKVRDRVAALQPGEELLLTPDSQDPANPDALDIHTADDRMRIGHCPEYLGRDFRRFLAPNGSTENNLKVRVRKVNPKAPLSLMLLCRLTCDAAPDFAPCESADFDILSPKMREKLANGKTR